MRIISIFLILFVIQVSFGAWLPNPDTASDALDSGEAEDGYQDNEMMKAKLQSEPEDDEEDDDNGDGSDVNNQDDDAEPNGETTQPSPPISSQPNNVDQSRGLPGASATENMSPPDYSSVNMRGYMPQCHGGQYQCQKTDPTAQTRCIPQEWRCNGLRDCENNDDESGCSTDQLTRGRTQAKCTQDQYQCHGTGINSVPPLCIERRMVCDGSYQCSYGDDEANCNDRRQPSVYPNRVPQRSDSNGQTNDRTTGRADPRDIYRPQPQPQPQPSSNDRKSEEYVQRLEWRDRCFRSCLKY
jgi:hypothetical protein